ncbi:ATP-binding protein [Streptomyces sp. NPDC054962]
MVSELVTNALKYAPGPILLELCINARAVDIVVWDSDPTVPAAQAADPDRIGQHGLEIVQAVTEDLFTEQAGGRQAHHDPHRPVRRPRWTCHQSPPLVADSAAPSACRLAVTSCPRQPTGPKGRAVMTVMTSLGAWAGARGSTRLRRVTRAPTGLRLAPSAFLGLSGLRLVPLTLLSRPIISPSGTQKICVGWSRHWMVSWVWFLS